MTKFDYKKAYEELIKEETAFIESIEQHISMIYTSGDAEQIMDIIDLIEKLMKIRREMYEDMI